MYAHTRPAPSDTSQWEPLELHLRRVAGDAELLGALRFAAAFDAAPIGRLLGLWHDIGKYAPDFQEYLQASHAGVKGLGTVDHSTAGALHAAERAGASQKLAATVVAFAIAGHHAGLADLGPAAESGTLLARLRDPRPETRRALASAPPSLREEPLPDLPGWLKSAVGHTDRPLALAMFIRMAFSALVDADRLATEWFDDSTRSSARVGASVSMSALRGKLDARLECFRSGGLATSVNAVRASLLASCRAKSALPPGLFTLTAPTGSGKTLSSMAFALQHAEAHGLQRVVYALPFTSVTEQNAAVFRACFDADSGPDSSRVVLEHHSAFTPSRSQNKGKDFGAEREGEVSPAERWRRLATENWDAPVVVTTNVQLLESLFSNNASDCRKLHRLARSVIVLDEAQSLPVHLLAPTLAALQELANGYGTTVVLCSATMPAVIKRPNFPIGLRDATEIVDDPAAMAESLRRTDVRLIGPMSDEQVVDRVVRTPRVLTIVNTRKQAARLFDAVRATGTPCRHLSALMCPQHRSARVAEIREALAKPDAPCRVISTQVVEAGIDIDFPVVYRAMAGLDSIIQSAGRCNREGRLSERGHVFVFDTDENPPPDIKRRIEATRDVLQDNADPLDLSTVEAWFREVYFRRKDEWDGGAGISVTADLAPDRLKFRSVAEQYNIIDQWSVPVVVPYEKEGAELCRLLQQSHKVEAHHLRQAQRYSVSVAPWALAHLQSQGHVTGGDTTLSVLISKSLYDDEVGLRLNGEPEPRDLCA